MIHTNVSQSCLNYLVPFRPDLIYKSVMLHLHNTCRPAQIYKTAVLFAYPVPFKKSFVIWKSFVLFTYLEPFRPVRSINQWYLGLVPSDLNWSMNQWGLTHLVFNFIPVLVYKSAVSVIWYLSDLFDLQISDFLVTYLVSLDLHWCTNQWCFTCLVWNQTDDGQISDNVGIRQMMARYLTALGSDRWWPDTWQ